MNKESKNIWFDMDGTIADLYGVNNWLTMIINENVTPYTIAKPLINMQVLAKTLNKLIQKGYTINIVSWLSKNGTPIYNEKVIQAKKQWLRKHLKSVQFSKIDIIKYGTPKQNNRSGILFDDEKPNRDTWSGIAYNEKNILKILKELA